MNAARELMLGYISGTAERSGALFAEDGTLELPYLASIGVPPVMTGPKAITDFLTFLHGTLYPGVSGKDVKQQFFGHLESAGGKIKRLREAIDAIVAAEAIFPNGLADVIKNRSKNPTG
jgi:uncharacterized protein